MGLAVEVLWLEEVGDLDHGVAIDEDGTEHGLLGLDGLRRKTVDHAVQIMGGWGDRFTVTDNACPVKTLIPESPDDFTGCVDDVWTKREPVARSSPAAARPPDQSRRRMTPISFPWIRTDG